MASQLESKIPAAGTGKEKRRSLLPAPKNYKHPAETQRLTTNPPDLTAEQATNQETSSNLAAPMSNKDTVNVELDPKFKEGDRVTISGVKFGTIKYFGRVHFAEGDWCGIELVDPDGKHDGNVGGHQYFNAKPSHGIFAPVDKVELATHASAFIPSLVKRQADDELPKTETSARSTRLIQPGTMLKSKIKQPETSSKSTSDARANTPDEEVPDGGGSEEATSSSSSEFPRLQSKLVRPKMVTRFGGSGIPKPEVVEGVDQKVQKPSKLPGIFQSKKIIPAKTESSAEGWCGTQSGIPRAATSKSRTDLNSTYTKSAGGEEESDSANIYVKESVSLNSTFVKEDNIVRSDDQCGTDQRGQADSPALQSPIPDLLTPSAYQNITFENEESMVTVEKVSFGPILTEEELAHSDLLDMHLSPSIEDVSKDSTELMEKELEQMSSLSSQDIDVPTPSFLTTTTGSLAGSDDIDQMVSIPFDLEVSYIQASTPERPRAGLSEPLPTEDLHHVNDELIQTGNISDSSDHRSNLEGAIDIPLSGILPEVTPCTNLETRDHEEEPVTENMHSTFIITEQTRGDESEDITTGETGNSLPTEEGRPRKERPVSIISTSSVDTAAMKPRPCHPAESDSDLYSDTGTLVADSETEKEDYESDDMVGLPGELAPKEEESDTESEPENVEHEEINVKELITPTQEEIPDFPDGGSLENTIGDQSCVHDSGLDENVELGCQNGVVDITVTLAEDTEAASDIDAEGNIIVDDEKACDSVEGSSQDVDVEDVVMDERGDGSGIMNLSIIIEAGEEFNEKEEVDVAKDDKEEETGPADMADVKDEDSVMQGDSSEPEEGGGTSEAGLEPAKEATPDSCGRVSVSSEAKSSDGGDQTTTKKEKDKEVTPKSEGKKQKETTKSPKSRTTKVGRKTPEVSPPKKPNVSKVRSSLADYINTPPPPPKPKEKEPETKINKNIINKKKIESKINTGGKGSLKEEKKSLVSPEKSSPESEPPKIIKRTPTKNKWDDIMSKINENKDSKPKAKTEIKSRLDNHLSTVATVTKAEKRDAKNDIKELSKRRQSAPVLPDFSSVKSKLNTQPPPGSRKSSLRPSSKKDNDSRVSSVHSSHSDLNTMVNESKKANKLKVEKPSNKKMSTLKRDQSPSIASVKSDISLRTASSVSQVSTTGSHSQRNKADKENTPTKTSRPKRQSISSLWTNTQAPAPAADRRLSLGTNVSSRPASGRSNQKTADGKKTSTPDSKRTGKDQTKTRKSSVTQIKGAHQPDLVSNSIGSRAHAAQEISRLEALCEARTKELNYTKLQLKSGIQGFDAMAIMVQYLTSDLNAFSTPELEKRLKSMESEVGVLQTNLDKLNDEKANLETMTHDLIQSHNDTLHSIRNEHKAQISATEDRLSRKNDEQMEKLHDQHTQEVKTLKSYHDKNLSEVKSEHEAYMQELEQSHSEKLLETGRKHEEHLEELQKQHEAKLGEITQRFEDIKVTLSDKVYTLKAECDELRSRSHMYEEALQRDTDYQVQLALLPYKDLPKEIQSLKTVLEMKNKEIHELRKMKTELEKQLEELPPARDRILALEQKIENLEAIIAIKGDYEKQLAEKHQVLMRKLDRESKANKRLSMDKEELQWKLNESDQYSQYAEFLNLSPTPKKASRSPTSLADIPSPDATIKKRGGRSPLCSVGSDDSPSQLPLRRSKSRTSDSGDKRTSKNYDDESKYYQTL